LLGLLATQDNPVQAIEWFEEAHQYAEDGVFPPALLARGVLHYEHGDLDEAESFLSGAMEYPLTAAKAEHALARTLTKQGRTEEALRTYAAASRRQDALPQVLVDWGSVLLDLNQVKEACRRLGRAVELDPGSVEAAVLFARAQQGCAGPAEAKRALDRADMLRNAIAPASYGPEKPDEGEGGMAPEHDPQSLVIALAKANSPLDRYPLAMAAVEPEEFVGWEPVLHENIEGLLDPDVAMADVIEGIEVGEGSVAAEAEETAEPPE
jgi:tetratricopeptide (TPR) repeat protein